MDIDKKSYKEFLKKIELFSDLTDKSLEMVLSNIKVKEYKKDKLLFLTGDKADFFYIIVSGWVKLYRETQNGHETVISMLSHRDIFGKTAILKNGTFAYNAQIVSDAVLLYIPSSFMLHMAEDHNNFDDFLSKFLESQIHETNQRYLEVEHLAKMTSSERVGCFLLKMCGSKKEGSLTFKLPYEKSLVAGRLGMTPETFSRSLNMLTSVGVETKNSAITINNIAQFQRHICEHCSAIKKECSSSEGGE